MNAATWTREAWNTGRSGMAHLRAVLRKHGAVSPVGDGNEKTDAPGTYRAVGLTCPETCPFLAGGCYARVGPVGIAQRRDDGDTGAAVRAFVVAGVSAARRGKLARIHVSGDFAGPDGRVDHGYVHAIADVASELRRLTGRRWVAWSYTHLPDGPWVELLREAGVAVRLSDRAGAWGAVVVPDATPVAGQFVCPAQTHGKTCSECGACWNATGKAVAFIAHGASAKKVREIVARRLDDTAERVAEFEAEPVDVAEFEALHEREMSERERHLLW